MRELHLFAGIGGGILGGMLLGHVPVAAVEINPYCRQVLKARQADGSLPSFPIFEDVKDFDGREWRGKVDIIAGGFPCQDISLAGAGKGLAGDRSGLWFEMLRVVRAVEPSFVFVENAAALRHRGLDTVLQGLAEGGFDAEWSLLSAASIGALHRRDRMWILGAHPDRAARAVADAALRQVHDRGPRVVEAQVSRGVGEHAAAVASGQDVAVAGSSGFPKREGKEAERALSAIGRSSWWASEPSVGRVVDGHPGRVDQLKALGNAQVPLCAAVAFEQLLRRFEWIPA